MIRLICIDVDGTLVGAAGTVRPEIWAEAAKLRASGVRLAICSGRPAFGTTREYAQRLDPEGWHCFQNGASVLHLPTGRSRSAALPPAGVATLIARARSAGRVLELYSDTAYAVESSGRLAREHADLLGVPFTPRSFESLGGEIVRAQWLLLHEEAAAVEGEPHPGLEMVPSTSPVMADTTFVNFTREGVTKGTAVIAVAQEYGIPLEEVMFVGDSLNDLAAMRVVGFPVAMGNADPELFEIARLEVGHVDEGGLVEALAHALTTTRQERVSG